MWEVWMNWCAVYRNTMWFSFTSSLYTSVYYSGGGRISCKWQNSVSGVHATIIIESSFLKFCEKAIYHINIYLLSVSGFGNIIRVISLIFSRYHILKRYRLWSARVQYNSPIELCVNRSELLCRIPTKRRSDDSAPFFAINHPGTKYHTF